MARKATRNTAARFGIGEWYGYSFQSMPKRKQQELAKTALRHNRQTEMPCPFKSPDGSEKCTKKGGVCSLRLYESAGHGTAIPAKGVEGDLRAVCPHRFRQNNIIYRTIGQHLLGVPEPLVVSEIRFLQRFRADDGAVKQASEKHGEREISGKEDVGNIDNVLVHPTASPMRWCALEIQAVYFSGTGMSSLFRSIRDYKGEGIPFPDAVRRPDYRSSGPKRLMPQLQIKVPTLRRWGKKMAVVVDAGFYRNLGQMNTVDEISNCDIAWFIARYDESGETAVLTLGEPEKQTLERAVEGLTGGLPVTLEDFESKIREKLNKGK
ncbi:MAG: hypothetical protein JW849_05395 [Phycisphaerae bacterium]|nr:hypothetical protein [Phycisphaerae bacterium]